jgi:hypothetical protein
VKHTRAVPVLVRTTHAAHLLSAQLRVHMGGSWTEQAVGCVL